MNENTTTTVQVIENASRDDVRPGDHITWERTWVRHGVSRFTCHEGIAHYRDRFGNWQAAEGGWLTDGEGPGTTLTIRRTIPVESGS